ncbi:MAG TPA: GNAT family N-acetyltransferase [Armatimonadota bacterium]|nr:GNAT family N-acetyltransferase [Armatimonadota bacterium]
MASETVNPTPLVIERLDKSVHDRMNFDCGEPELNDYLRFTARQHVDKGYAQVWVAVTAPGSAQVLGYYALSMTSLAPGELPRKNAIKKVPALLLGKLAVDKRYQGQSIGVRLLMDAQRSALLVSRQVGVYALVVDALNDRTAAFYRKYGFEELSTGPQHLFKTIKDIERMGLLDAPNE